jgi:hypothetical protein
MSDVIMDNEPNQEPNEPATKSFSQDELERIVEQRLARERRKYEKQLEGVDLDEARRLMEEKQAAELERQKEKGEFEKVLKQVTEKKDQTIQTLNQKLYELQVDGALVNAASQSGAVNPSQVVQLLKGQTRLNEEGQVEILDSDGTVRYNDTGSPLSVNEYVSDFLTANPHFVKASPSGAGSKGAAGGSTPKPESVADMLANWTSGGKEAYAALKKGKR